MIRFAQLRALALAIVALLTGGCAERLLTRQQLASLSQLEAFVCTSQTAIYALPPPDPRRQSVTTPMTTSSGKTDQTASLFTGLATAVITGIDRGTRSQNAKERAERPSQALKTFDFRSDLVDAARVELAKVTTVKIDVQSAIVTDNCWEAMTAAIHAPSASNALLFVTVSYFVASDGDRVGFAADARIYPRPNVGPALYGRTFEYNFFYDSRRDVRDAFRGAGLALFAKLAADLNRP